MAVTTGTLTSTVRALVLSWSAVIRFTRLRVVAVMMALAAAVVLTAGAAFSSAAGAPKQHDRVIYTVASDVQFLNNADDLVRGTTNNPFSPATNKLRPSSSLVKQGQTLPGDVALFSFDLYQNAALTKSAGSATYTCYFNYGEHALCQAYFAFNGSGDTLVAAGPVNFKEKGFDMVVTGGTNNYFAARGELTAVPALKKAQRVHFVLLSP